MKRRWYHIDMKQADFERLAESGVLDHITREVSAIDADWLNVGLYLHPIEVQEVESQLEVIYR